MCHQIDKLKIATCHLDPQNQDKYFFQSYWDLIIDNYLQ